MSPQFESWFIVEGDVEIVRKGWEVLSWDSIESSADKGNFFSDRFEGIMTGSLLDILQKSFGVGFSIFCLVQVSSLDELGEIWNSSDVLVVGLIHCVTNMERSEHMQITIKTKEILFDFSRVESANVAET